MLVPADTLNERDDPKERRKIVILGSTGSIGCSALEIVRQFPSRFEVLALVAGKNVRVIAEQAQEFKPRFIVLTDPAAATTLRTMPLPEQTEVLDGVRAVEELASHPDADVVLAAIVGLAGLSGVIAALKAGKCIALANKESLVAAGTLVRSIQEKSGAYLIPVDSEHAALFQALQGERARDVARLVLTASGGPFLHTPQNELKQVTVAQALRHPRWNMGAKITIDSATMVNKALELIEARWLFDIDERRIDVVVHPQSIVHSAITYVDGTTIAQLSLPDMKAPIAYALTYPHGRLPNVLSPLDFTQVQRLEFLALNNEKFPAVNIARSCLSADGAMPAVFSIANELAVREFLAERISFDQIIVLIQKALSDFSGASYKTMEDLLDLERRILNKMGGK